MGSAPSPAPFSPFISAQRPQSAKLWRLSGAVRIHSPAWPGFWGFGAALAGSQGAFPCQRQGEANSLGERPVANWEAASCEKMPVAVSPVPSCPAQGEMDAFRVVKHQNSPGRPHVCSSPWGTGWCRSRGWRHRGFVCAGMCPALGDECDEGTCKKQPRDDHRRPEPSHCWWHLTGEPGQVCEGWALPGWLLPTSKGTCVPAALLADWEGVRRWF